VPDAAKKSRYRWCGRCGKEYDGVTPHGPGNCAPQEPHAAWVWHRSAERDRAISDAVDALRNPPTGGYESKELRGIVTSAVMRTLNAAGVPLPNYRVPPEWEVEVDA
jgi:hypothetical protein